MMRKINAFLVLAAGVAVALGAACQPKQTGQAGSTAAATTAAGAAAGVDRKQVVGRVDGDPITMGEVEDKAKGALVSLNQQIFEARSGALDQLIDERLVAKKAKAENLTPEKLLERDVYSKVSVPNDDEMKQLYDQAVAEGRQLPPLEEIKGQIAEFIKGKKTETALEEYHQKLRAAAKVEEALPPFRVEVAAAGPTSGEAKALVTMVEFSDYQCPFCGRQEPTVKRLLDEYKGKVKLVYREFPLPSHDHAQKASEAALCAEDQGKYWEMHEKLFANQTALEVPRLKSYAKDLSLDTAKFDKCLDGSEKAAAVQSSVSAGKEAGVNGTPAMFINGRPLAGLTPYEKLKEVIDAELARAKP
jgi:protein-disulfide isomerase